MKKPIFLLICFLFMTCFTAHSQQKTVYADNYIVKVGDQAPDFTIKEASGSSYRLSSLKGKVIMLQFTASWCSVCRQEMPFIEKEIWQPGKPKGLVVLGIDRDEPEETVIKFRKDIKVSYPLCLDPGAGIFSLFAQKESGVTRNVIIGRNGKIIFLTRLFEKKEFDEMKTVIFKELQTPAN